MPTKRNISQSSYNNAHAWGFFLPIFVFFIMCRAYFFHEYVLFSSGGPLAQSLSVLPVEVWERAGEFLSVTSQLRVES